MPDTAGPLITVSLPTAQDYDNDADRLVDVHVLWSDSAGAVDPVSARLRALDGVNGPSSETTNLLSVWRVARLDSGGLVVHETIENLLHGGMNRLEISVADTAGNVATDTISVTLPHGAFIKTLTTGLVSQTSHGIGMVVCQEDRRAYMTAGRRLVVVDADSLVIRGIVPNNQASDDLQIPLCVPGDPLIVRNTEA